MISVIESITSIFVSVIDAFTFGGINVFYVLAGCTVAGCLLSITFHNKG